jgi:hypothetical protein
MEGHTLLKNTELFAKKMDCGSLPTHSTHLILQPSDFFMFSYVKEPLKGMMSLSDEELLDAINEVVTGIESETLTAVFEDWMERLEWVSTNNGDYYL